LAALFRENGIEHKKVDYFSEPLTAEQVGSLISKIGRRPFEMLRRGDPAFKTLGLSTETPDSEVLQAIAENPGLLQRPIVEVGDRAVIARPVEKALELIK
jgi:arsenate reductase